MAEGLMIPSGFVFTAQITRFSRRISTVKMSWRVPAFTASSTVRSPPAGTEMSVSYRSYFSPLAYAFTATVPSRSSPLFRTVTRTGMLFP